MACQEWAYSGMAMSSSPAQPERRRLLREHQCADVLFGHELRFLTPCPHFFGRKGGSSQFDGWRRHFLTRLDRRHLRTRRHADAGDGKRRRGTRAESLWSKLPTTGLHGSNGRPTLGRVTILRVTDRTPGEVGKRYAVDSYCCNT